MCKFICSLYETTLRLPYMSSFYSEPELPIEVTRKDFYRWLGAPDEPRRSDATARSPRYPPLDSLSALFGLSAWSTDAERPPRLSGNKCQ
jgi:hypothetical protein